MRFECWTDGSTVKKNSRDSKGHSGAGVVVVDSVAGSIQFMLGEYIGVTTNNYAEFKAVDIALDELIMRQDQIGPVDIDIVSDSQVLVKSMAGKWELKEPSLIELKDSIKKKEHKLKGEVSYTWVKAHSGVELNEWADKLARACARG